MVGEGTTTIDVVVEALRRTCEPGRYTLELSPDLPDELTHDPEVVRALLVSLIGSARTLSPKAKVVVRLGAAREQVDLAGSGLRHDVAAFEVAVETAFPRGRRLSALAGGLMRECPAPTDDAMGSDRISCVEMARRLGGDVRLRTLAEASGFVLLLPHERPGRGDAAKPAAAVAS